MLKFKYTNTKYLYPKFKFTNKELPYGGKRFKIFEGTADVLNKQLGTIDKGRGLDGRD